MGARPTYVPNRRPGDDHIFDELSRRDYEAFYTLKTGDVVIDAGAHAGFFATYAADKVGPDGLVLAFEPEVDNFKLLLENTQACANVRCYPFALWSGVAQLPLSLSPSSAEHSLMYPRLGNQVQLAECVSVDGLFAALPAWPAVSFVKIDVEGAEREVLRGAAAVLHHCRPHIAIELDEKEVAKTQALLVEVGYKVHVRRGSGVFLYGEP
jgi:FkbM family methyltransferase